MIRTRRAKLAVAIVLAVGGLTAAWGWWTATSTVGGYGSAVVAAVNQGSRPTVPASGTTSVTVTWTATTLSNGHAVAGYIVTRYDAHSLVAQTTLPGCAGTITATSCTETTVPQGQWTYAITPVIGTNWRGVESPQSTIYTYDTTPPTGGFIDATNLVGTGGRYSTSLSLTLSFAKGSDPWSGLATTGAQVLRASATLSSPGVTDGACGTYGGFVQLGANDPASPMATTVPTDARCYRYEYVVPDKAGNVATYTSPDIKVDTTAPPFGPVGGLSGFVNSYWNGDTTVYYRPGAPNGSFTLNATAADTTSGISGFAFPTFPAGWTMTPGAFGVATYSYSAPNPAQPIGGQSVIAVNGAGLHSPASVQVMVLADATVPTGGNISYAAGYSTSGSASVGWTEATDTGSGIDDTGNAIQRASAAMSAGVCGAFGAFTTVATDPASPFVDTVGPGSCYEYRYVATDNVGNQTIYTSPNILKVDTQAPSHSLSLTSPVGAFLSGATLYYNANAAGSFALVDALADNASGPASVTFPNISAAGWSHSSQTVSTPNGGPYASSSFSWTTNPSLPTGYTLTGRDGAGNTSADAMTFVKDITAPTAGSVAYTDGVVNTLSVPIATAIGTDAGSGVNAPSATLMRRSATLTTATETCGAFGAFSAVTLTAGSDVTVVSGTCYQYEFIVSDHVGNVATFVSASVAKVDTSGPKVTAIASQQSSGATGNGRLEVGDKLVVTFNQSLATASVPNSFTGATEARTTALADVFLTIPGITDGALDTGPTGLYLTPSAVRTATFNGTIALANNGTSTTVTVTVTTLTGDATLASSGTLTFKPAPTITDSAGDGATGSFTTPLAFKLF